MAARAEPIAAGRPAPGARQTAVNLLATARDDTVDNEIDKTNDQLREVRAERFCVGVDETDRAARERKLEARLAELQEASAQKLGEVQRLKSEWEVARRRESSGPPLSPAPVPRMLGIRTGTRSREHRPGRRSRAASRAGPDSDDPEPANGRLTTRRRRGWAR